jgi:hypothetical protein
MERTAKPEREALREMGVFPRDPHKGSIELASISAQSNFLLLSAVFSHLAIESKSRHIIHGRPGSNIGFWDEMIQHMKARGIKRILEVGSGNGLLKKMVEKKLKGTGIKYYTLEKGQRLRKAFLKKYKFDLVISAGFIDAPEVDSTRARRNPTTTLREMSQYLSNNPSAAVIATSWAKIEKPVDFKRLNRDFEVAYTGPEYPAAKSMHPAIIILSRKK